MRKNFSSEEGSTVGVICSTYVYYTGNMHMHINVCTYIYVRKVKYLQLQTFSIFSEADTNEKPKCSSHQIATKMFDKVRLRQEIEIRFRIYTDWSAGN